MPFSAKYGIALLAAVGLASAHFTLDYPTSRGFDDDNEPEFCGGFTNVETRQPFPLMNGPIWIDSHHTAATLDAFLSVNQNPTSFNDFNTTSNGTAIPMVTNFFQIKEPGEFCWNVSLANLGIGLQNGSLVTLQIQYDGGDGELYQCTDLILLSDYTAPADRRCPIDATSDPTGTVSFAGASSTAGSSSTSAGGSASGTTSQASQTSRAAASSTSGASRAKTKLGSWTVLGSLVGVAGISVM
ncbi:hypothetical protein BD324DRAFT_634860 [Kockovaella imperatae]|uniref:Copper acquisition factor BIM1-like domain-containing protein n=1 Tax=Kockovaella imperatae TaxID=4999 RepID=A0A1Y1U9S3_9TREE|nr:hypothetical protein BD324DRAFT_634860 [Kockovaella imperatae]ORX34762.1 hypothetical protein BD324DRAFT_634860 [Kockovaella imperatae]